MADFNEPCKPPEDLSHHERCAPSSDEASRSSNAVARTVNIVISFGVTAPIIWDAENFVIQLYNPDERTQRIYARFQQGNLFKLGESRRSGPAGIDDVTGASDPVFEWTSTSKSLSYPELQMIPQTPQSIWRWHRSERTWQFMNSCRGQVVWTDIMTVDTGCLPADALAASCQRSRISASATIMSQHVL